ncbi:hypothetical protein MRX96_041737 [Rhipicephalus microplus]
MHHSTNMTAARSLGQSDTGGLQSSSASFPRIMEESTRSVQSGCRTALSEHCSSRALLVSGFATDNQSAAAGRPTSLLLDVESLSRRGSHRCGRAVVCGRTRYCVVGEMLHPRVLFR